MNLLILLSFLFSVISIVTICFLFHEDGKIRDDFASVLDNYRKYTDENNSRVETQWYKSYREVNDQIFELYKYLKVYRPHSKTLLPVTKNTQDQDSEYPINTEALSAERF